MAAVQYIAVSDEVKKVRGSVDELYKSNYFGVSADEYCLFELQFVKMKLSAP
jgi:hypothetical protein